MARFKLKIAAALCTMALLPAGSYAQDVIDVRQVSSDSLVTLLKKDFGARIYFMKSAEDIAFYNISAPRESFLREALSELKSKGYSVTDYDGAWFITHGNGLVTGGLPAGFFDPDQKKHEKDGLSLLGESENVMASFRNKVYEIGDRDSEGGSRAYVRGYIRDVASGEPLVGVSVYDGKTGAYTVSDAYGFYRLSLPTGACVLNFSGYSMEDLALNLMVHSDGGLDVMMKEKVTSLKAALVSADNQSQHRDARMGVQTVRINTIKKVPTAFGEADVLKVVLTLPGVKSVGEAASGFNVRGGSTDQNLILFNDGTIFSPSHMFGVLSSFNADVINDVELYKSSIPAEYGGRISSVLEIRSKEGNANKLTGTIGLGLLTSNFTFEGPIKKGKTTFMLGGRTTYSDWMLRALPASSNYSGGSAGFYDINAGISHKINARNSLHAHAYWSRDRFGFTGDTTFRYSNLNASLKWISHLSEKTNLTLAGGYDRFESALEDTHWEPQSYRMSTYIQQGFLRLGFKSGLGSHQLSYGAQATYYDLNPGHFDPLGDGSWVISDHLDNQTAADLALYMSDVWSPAEKLSLEYGVRLAGYLAMNPSKFSLYPEFRVSGRYSILSNLSLKAGFNSMSQNLHMISNNTSVSPVDTWRLSNERLRPQTGWQAAAGLYWTVADGLVDISAEGYFKRTFHYPDYKSGAVLSMNHNLEDCLVETTGKAWGVEFMVRKTLGKLNGWVSYTYSRARLRESADRGVDTINGGDWYNASFDKPHDFKMVLNYKLTHRFSFSVNADYSTGRPVTVPVGMYWYANTYALAYSGRNMHRIPDYFRMDIAMNIEPSHYLKQLAHMSVTFGVYNVTARKNAYSVFYTANNGTNVNGYMLSVFAVPIPYVNFNVRF